MAICPQPPPPFPPFLVVPHSFISCAVRVSRHLPANLPPSLVSSHSFLLLCVSQLSPQSTWSILIITSLNYPQLPLSPPWSLLEEYTESIQAERANKLGTARNRNLSDLCTLGSVFSPAKGNDLEGQRQREGERKTEREGCLGSKRTPSRGLFARLHNTLLSISLSLIFFLSNCCGCPLPASSATATATSFVLCDNVAKVSHVASSAELMRTPRARVAPRESPLKRKMCKS